MSPSVVRTLKSRLLHYITLDIRGHFSQLAINGWDDETTKTIVKSTECTTATVNTTNSTAITRTWWAMKGGNLIKFVLCLFVFGQDNVCKGEPVCWKNLNKFNKPIRFFLFNHKQTISFGYHYSNNKQLCTKWPGKIKTKQKGTSQKQQNFLGYWWEYFWSPWQ